MRRFFEPAAAPAWLKAVLSSIRAALGDVWDVPLRPFQAAAADLPAAADYTGGLVWNTTTATVNWSDGSAWKAPQASDARLDAIAGLTPAADQAIYWTSAAAAAMTGLTGFGRSLIDDADAAAARGTLGLGTAAVKDTGTSGNKVPLLDGANTWSANQAITGTFGVAGQGNNNAVVNVTPGGTGTSSTLNLNGNGGSTALALIGVNSGTALSCRIRSDSIIFQNAAASAYASVTSTGLDLQAGVYRVNTAQVVTSRRTGWSTATGTATRAAFDTTSVTLPQLAERVKALLDDLHATAGHGLIGN